jgi:hypothetical protein
MKNFRPEVAAMCLAVALGGAPALSAQRNDKDGKAQDTRPKLTLRAQPAYGIAPTRVVLTAELVGGANDFEEYYCPTVRWEWGDDTSSESTLDCAPYEAGKTEIKRRFTVEHNFRRAGSYKIYFKLKRHDKEVASASTLVQLQPGAGDLRP